MTGRYNYQRFSDWIGDPRVMELGGLRRRDLPMEHFRVLVDG